MSSEVEDDVAVVVDRWKDEDASRRKLVDAQTTRPDYLSEPEVLLLTPFELNQPGRISARCLSLASVLIRHHTLPFEGKLCDDKQLTVSRSTTVGTPPTATAMRV